jgi:hypothetical protein
VEADFGRTTETSGGAMKTFNFILALTVLAVTVTMARAAETPATFDQANAAFAQKDFARASTDFQQIITRQGFSAPVLFNLANTYFQQGKLGLAILNYQRAEVLAPADADIAFNLHLARTRAGLADRPMTWFEQSTHLVTMNTIAYCGAAAMLILLAGALSRAVSRKHRFAWRLGMITSACVLLISVLALSVRWPELNQAIVTVKNAPVYIAPVTVGQPLYTLAEGQTVTIRGPHGEFTLVETSDGHRGWVKTADIGRIFVSTLQPGAGLIPLA